MNRQDVAVRLRTARPLKLRVVLNDETEKPVAMPRGRQRWDKAAAIIDALPWATVYMLDGQGNICAEPIHRDDASSPAAELEDVPKNPTMAIVHGVMAHLAPVLRDVHKVATGSAVELVTKIRSVHKDEMKDIITGYTELLAKTFDRLVSFEERSNELMAENDALRSELAAARTEATSNTEAERERMLLEMVTGKKMPAPGGDAGKGDGSGSNGAG